MKTRKNLTSGEPAVNAPRRTDGEAADDADREARDREVFDRFEEDLLLVAEILARQVQEASRPEVSEPYYHPDIDEEMEALKRHMKQIQTIIVYLQALKKLHDKRLKGLREIRDWVQSHGRERRGR